MKATDIVFSCLLIGFALIHGAGAWFNHHAEVETEIWLLAGGLAQVFLAAINLLRVGRPDYKALAAVSLAACIAWLALITAFGVMLHKFSNPHVSLLLLITLVLALFSLRTLIRAGGGALQSQA